jgi:hypothetical protein
VRDADGGFPLLLNHRQHRLLTSDFPHYRLSGRILDAKSKGPLQWRRRCLRALAPSRRPASSAISTTLARFLPSKREEQAFQELHKRCAQMLEVYVREAHRMCEMLGKAEPGPLGLTVRSDILEQRHRENEAHARFQEIRNLLLDLVQIGYQR